MKMLKLSLSYMKQAEARVKDAVEAFNDDNYPYALRLSQESVELCLKASLRLVGIEYPKVHDVSNILIRYIDRFPDWFRKEGEFLSETSKKLVMKRELSFYGGEEVLLTPDELISKEDAHEAVKRAEKIFKICSKLIDEYEERYERERGSGNVDKCGHLPSPS